ncbi:hypothetical protein [Streptacidiphilus cavernicola]|uniref:Uncharacterized protein n=1 Tax=Streptacidiphilus cavernicola TaxID=3342716 RepID=A0ABV6VXR2_9ACTN
MPTRDELLDRLLLLDSLEVALDGGCGICGTEWVHLCAGCGRCRCYDHDTCQRPEEAS